MTEHADIVIVGGGIAGMSLAYWLAREAKVVVLEMESAPGYHSSGRSASYYNVGLGKPTVRALSAFSEGFFKNPPSEFGEHPLAIDCSAITVARRSQMSELTARCTEVSRYSPDCKIISGVEIKHRVPIMKTADDRAYAGLLDSTAKKLDTHALLHGYLRGCRQAGGVLLTNRHVDEIQYAGSRWEIRSGDYRIQSQIIVNAAGAWGDHVASLASVRPVGLRPLRRSIAVIPSPNGYDCSTWDFVRSLSEEFYFGPEAGNLLISAAGEDESAPMDVQADELDVAIAVDRFESVTDVSVTRIVGRWAGLRTFVADRLPVVGFDTMSPAFFWLVGQGGTGFQTAPALGAIASNLILNRGMPDGIAELGITAAALAPDRLR